MIRGLMAILLPGLSAHTQVQDLATSYTSEDYFHRSADNIEEKAFEPMLVHYTAMDDATLGKSSHLARFPRVSLVLRCALVPFFADRIQRKSVIPRARARSGRWMEVGFARKSTRVAKVNPKWGIAMKLLRSEEVKDVYIKGFSTRGLEVVIEEQLFGFLPWWALKEERAQAMMSPETREAFGIRMLGQSVKAIVTRVDVRTNNVIVSERAPIKASALHRIQLGQTFYAVVKNIRLWGVFVTIVGAEFYGVDGLIPTSELSWEAVSDPRTVVQPGQRVRVKVVDISKERSAIGFSLKLTSNDTHASVEFAETPESSE